MAACIILYDFWWLPALFRMISDGFLHYSVWFLMAACIILYDFWWLPALFCMISDGCLHYCVWFLMGACIIPYDFWWLPALFCMISDGCLHYSVWFLMAAWIILYDFWWLPSLFCDKFMYALYVISNTMHKSQIAVHFRKLSIVRRTQFCGWLMPISRWGRPELL